ncbi:MAG: MarR family transcriptional regulator [Pseudomonadota bacterium]
MSDAAPDTDLALLIDRLMRHIHFGLQAKSAEFDTARVGPGGGIILLTLADMGTPALSELTRRLARDKSQMTRAIRGLEEKGLLERSPSPEDGRVTRVALTAEGRDVVSGLHHAVAETIHDVLGPVSAEERATLQGILARALTPPPVN